MPLRRRAALAALLLALSAGVWLLRSTPPSKPGERETSVGARVEAGREALAAKRQKLATRGPKPFDAPRRAHDFFVEQRMPKGARELPIEHLLEQHELLESRIAGQSMLQAPPGGIQGWEPLGPGNIGGRTRSLVIDPDDPDLMYAGGVAGGVWKSTDAGASWKATDDFLLNLSIGCLAMDPGDSSVLYAGTGEGFLSVSSFVRGLGIFKSVDAGASWTQLAGTVAVSPSNAFHYVNDIVVSPNDSQRVYAATRTGVWRSDDGGTTWAVVLANPDYVLGPSNSAGCFTGCTELVVRDDRAPDTLFASFGIAESDGLYRSFDGGDSWQAYTVGSNQGRMTLALAPSDQDVMYVLMADNGTVGGLGQVVDVFRSEDGGDSFEARLNHGSVMDPWLLSNLSLATGCLEEAGPTYHQGWYDSAIAVDPFSPDTVWVGGIDLFRSTNGGRDFQAASYWMFYTLDPTPPYYVHADQHLLVFHPDYDGLFNQTLFACNDGGIFRTENALALASQEDCPLPGDLPLPELAWQNLNNGYGVTQFYHGDSAKQIPMYVGGAQDNGTSRVLSAQTPDAWELVFGGDGGYVAIDPTNPDVVYVEYQFFPNFQKSIDGGETFVEANNGITDTDGVFITPFAMDQQQPEVLWTGGTRPWRTMNGADLWEPAGPDLPGAGQITAIGIAPSDSEVVYLGFTNGRVAKTTNGLSPSPSWTVYQTGLQGGGWVSCVTVDPVDPTIAYATFSSYGTQHIRRTTDGGQSWSSIDGVGFAGVPDIPVHWLEVRPCNSNQLFAATELGVFASPDAGASWHPANAGLANVVVESLDWKDEDTLVAFTHGRGAFQTSLRPCRRIAAPVAPTPKPPSGGR